MSFALALALGQGLAAGGDEARAIDVYRRAIDQHS
jgi:hypothetical protein